MASVMLRTAFGRAAMVKGWGVLLLSLWATGAWAREVREGTPAEVEVNGKTLELNGVGVLRKFVFDVYSAALYLERPTRDGAEAVRSDQAKQIRLRLLRSASREQISGALREGLHAGGANLTGLDRDLEALLAGIPDLRSGDVLEITYVPGRGTTLRRAGQGVSFEGKRFADAIFSIWLGRDPRIVKVKQGLLGN